LCPLGHWHRGMSLAPSLALSLALSFALLLLLLLLLLKGHIPPFCLCRIRCVLRVERILVYAVKKNENQTPPHPARTTHNMRILPVSLLGTPTADELEMSNCSNRAYVPDRLFTQWLRTSQVSLRIQNAVEQTVMATMYHAHSNAADVVYVPDWMLAALDCDVDTCVVEPVELPMCTSITLQPHNEGDVEDMEIFQLSLELYSSVRAGQELTLRHPYGYPFVVNVCAVEPEEAWVSIAQADVPLTMLPPIVQTKEPVGNTVAATTENTLATEAGAATAATAATVATDATTLRQRCLEAALRRMQG
jgi:hypothetical protein